MSEETRSIVPRKDGEAGIGREDKYWGKGYFGTVKARDELTYKGKELSDILAEKDKNLSDEIAKVNKHFVANEEAITTNATDIAKNTSNINANKENITAVSKEITGLKASVGTPLVAATASAMTDKNKIYVYTGTESGYTKGNWYFNDGSSWVSGGVYNSIAFETDTTLTVSGKAADAKITGNSVRALYKSVNRVEGDSFDSWGSIPNSRIVSTPINATKGTIIHLIATECYYAVNDGDWTKEDTVIDQNKVIQIWVCKSKQPTTQDIFGSVDEIKDIVACLYPVNMPDKNDAIIEALCKSVNRVEGDSFDSWGSIPNSRIVSTPINATKGTIIHLIATECYYAVNDGDWTKEDTVIDQNKVIQIWVCKSKQPTTQDIFGSVDEIKDIVACLYPVNMPDKNESEENKELVRQATYSSEDNYAGNKSTPVFSLLHFSDLHADKDALKRIVTKSAEYPLDDMICTGDMVFDNASESFDSWWEPKILTCIGNHDSAIRTYHDGISSPDWSKLSMQERDTKYISPFISQWGNVAHESGTSYYFKDYPTKKVRLVVVDIMLYLQKEGSTSHETESAEQTQWLEKTLQSAIDLDYHVLIATHSPLLGAKIKECSFSPYNSDGTPFADNWLSVTTILQDTVDKYIKKGLHFVCYLSGHMHKDAVVYVDKTTRQIQVLITCANASNKSLWGWGDQYRGVNDDAMNIVCVDAYHNILKLVRIGGANIDKYMRPRKAISINYATGKICAEIK